MHRLLRSLLGLGVALAFLPDARGLDSWNAPVIPSGLPALETVAFGNGLFVAAGPGTAYATSPDGFSWEARTLPAQATAGLNRLVFDNGIFVGAGNNGCILVSPDGVNWTAPASGTSVHLVGIAPAGSGRWAILGKSGASAIVLESTDNATSWNLHPAASFTPYEISFGKGWFVAPAATGLGVDLRRTPDLAAWESTLGFDMGSALPQPRSERARTASWRSATPADCCIPPTAPPGQQAIQGSHKTSHESAGSRGVLSRSERPSAC